MPTDGGPSCGAWVWRQGAVLLAVGLAALLPTFLGRDLWRFDEVRWSQVARELARSDNWFVLRLLGDYYPDKPPFYFWVSAALFRLVGGANPVTSRLISAVSVLIVAWTTWRVGRRLYGDRAGVGIWAALLWLTSALPGLLGTAVAVDPFYSVWVVGANSAAAWAVADGRWRRGVAIAFSLCMELAMFTKGPVGLALPLATLGLAWAIGVPLPKGTRRPVVWGMVAALAPTAFWLIQAARVVGFTTILTQAGVHGFGYAANSWSHPEPPWMFLTTFWTDFFPASLLFPAALAAFWLRRGGAGGVDRVDGVDEVDGVDGEKGLEGLAFARREAGVGWWRRLRGEAAERSLDFFLLAWFFGIFLLHSAASGKRSPYIMPAFPAAALLIARAFLPGGIETSRAVSTAAARRAFSRLARLARWILVAMLIGLGLAALAHPLYFQVVLDRIAATMSDTPDLDAPSLAGWQELVFFGGGVAALGLAWATARGDIRKRGRAGTAGERREDPAFVPPILPSFVATGLLTLFLFGAIAGPLLNPLHSGRSLVRAAAPYLNDRRTVVLFRSPDPAWLLAWHLDPRARVLLIRSTERYGKAIARTTPPVIIILERDRYEENFEADMPEGFRLLGQGLVATETFLILGKGVAAEDGRAAEAQTPSPRSSAAP